MSTYKWYISNLLIQFKSYIFFRLASANGHLEVVKTLLEWGANIEATDENGFNALMKGIFLIYQFNGNR